MSDADFVAEAELEKRSQFFVLAWMYLAHRYPDTPIPEVLLVIKPDQMLQFVRMFGGQTVRIPDIADLSDGLKVASALYLRLTKGRSWQKIKYDLNLDHAQMVRLRAKAKAFLSDLRKQGADIPSLFKEPS